MPEIITPRTVLGLQEKKTAEEKRPLVIMAASSKRKLPPNTIAISTETGKPQVRKSIPDVKTEKPAPAAESPEAIAAQLEAQDAMPPEPPETDTHQVELTPILPQNQVGTPNTYTDSTTAPQEELKPKKIRRRRNDS